MSKFPLQLPHSALFYNTNTTIQIHTDHLYLYFEVHITFENFNSTTKWYHNYTMILCKP